MVWATGNIEIDLSRPAQLVSGLLLHIGEGGGRGSVRGIIRARVYQVCKSWFTAVTGGVQCPSILLL